MVLTWLHTDGKYIKNEYGLNLPLRGLAMGGMGESGLSYWNCYGTGDSYQRLVQTFNLMLQLCGSNKPNVLRCMTGYDFGWSNPGIFNQAIDDLVALATQNDIHVIVEFHGVPWGSPEVQRLKADPTDWINWFRYFATRYKDNPTVAGFEIWNEPSSSDWTQAQWRNVATRCYNAIREINPKALIIVPGIPFGEISLDWINNPLGPQAVYSWDSYYYQMAHDWYHLPYDTGDYSTGRARLENWMANNNRINANIPVICSEFGFHLDDSLHAVADWCDIMNKHETSWYYFWWWGNPGNQGMFDGSTNTLSPFGAVIRNYFNTLLATHRLTVNSNLQNIPFTINRIS